MGEKLTFDPAANAIMVEAAKLTIRFLCSERSPELMAEAELPLVPRTVIAVVLRASYLQLDLSVGRNCVAALHTLPQR